jgi:Zn finger protein HypA/HybF involved in hydrogenase expression
MTYSDSWYGRSGIHPVLGVLLGLIVGILTDIIGGGFIATILNIDENLEQVRNNSLFGKMKEIKEQKKCKRCHKSVDIDYTSCPHCGTSDFE